MKLHKAIDAYIASKRDLGISFDGGSAALRRLEKQVGDVDLDQIRKMHICSFLDGPRLAGSTWRDRYFVLCRFLEYCYARRYVSTIAMPDRRLAQPSNFVPHIYSRDELRRLLKAVPSARPDRRKIAPETLRMIILFLYGTGASIGETLRLQREDIDFRKKELTLFSRKFNGTRRIPINTDLCRILRAYDKKSTNNGHHMPFFRTRHGDKLPHDTLNENFRQLRKAAKISRPGGLRCQPRLSDLRHTFAAHRVASWLKHGADLNRMIPALSAYLGYIGLSSAESYLRLIPERFRKQLSLLSHDKRRPTWRKNMALMQFLDSL